MGQRGGSKGAETKLSKRKSFPSQNKRDEADYKKLTERKSKRNESRCLTLPVLVCVSSMFYLSTNTPLSSSKSFCSKPDHLKTSQTTNNLLYKTQNRQARCFPLQEPSVPLITHSLPSPKNNVHASRRDHK